MREKHLSIRIQHEATPALSRQVRLCCFALILNPADGLRYIAPRRCRLTATTPSIKGRIPSSPAIQQTAARSLPAIIPTVAVTKARWWPAPGILSVTVQTYIFKFKWNYKPYEVIFTLNILKINEIWKFTVAISSIKSLIVRWISIALAYQDCFISIAWKIQVTSVVFPKIQGCQVHIFLVIQVWWMDAKKCNGLLNHP